MNKLTISMKDQLESTMDYTDECKNVDVTFP